jgi:hypothetical protein
MSTRNFLGGKKEPARKADNLTAICEPQPLVTLRASTACYRDNFTLQNQKDEMGRTFDKHEKHEMHTKFWKESLKKIYAWMGR